MTEERADGALTLSAKVNRLFEVYRSRDESEQSEDAVARSVSHILGRDVAAADIAALRRGDDGEIDADLLSGVIRHFGVPAAYLTTSGAHAESVDKQLQLLVAARDAGVERLALRGMDLENALEPTLALLKEIAASEESDLR